MKGEMAVEGLYRSFATTRECTLLPAFTPSAILF